MGLEVLYPLLENPLVVCATALLAILIGRVAQNAVRGKTPPVFEGLPFVGGLLKFVKVGCAWLCVGRGGCAPASGVSAGSVGGLAAGPVRTHNQQWHEWQLRTRWHA